MLQKHVHAKDSFVVQAAKRSKAVTNTKPDILTLRGEVKAPEAVQVPQPTGGAHEVLMLIQRECAKKLLCEGGKDGSAL